MEGGATIGINGKVDDPSNDVPERHHFRSLGRFVIGIVPGHDRYLILQHRMVRSVRRTEKKRFIT